MELSKEIVELLNEHWPGKNIYEMSLEELEKMRVEVVELREEYTLLEMAMKTLGNAAYGASANEWFYFYNLALAADITGECRVLTKFMWDRLELFFHEDIWERKDLWERFDFALDESKHDWYREQPVSIYSDTDSVYVTYGTLFKCFTKESLDCLDTDRKKVDWILKFNQEFLDKQNFEWLNEMYTPRHAKNIHNFELETISVAGIYLKKKKYLKALSFSKGKFFDNPKISGTGIEIVKSTTPKLCREILIDMTRSLVFETGQMSKDEYILYFNQKLADWKRKFYSVPVEDISQSIGIGAYKKYVLNDTTSLEFAPKAPTSVKCIARYNYLAHQNGQDNLKMISGKVKYYNIRVGRTTDYFGFPAGELPSFAPPIDYPTQWQKTVIDPLNRFLEVMDLPSVNIGGTIQYSLFE